MRRASPLLWLPGLLAGFATAARAQESEGTNAPPSQGSAPEQPAPAAAAPAEAAPAAEVAAAAPAIAPPGSLAPKFGDFSAHGYFRGGFGANIDQKGRQTCFQLSLPNAMFSKYRLGNECEVWAELDTRTVVYVGDDGSVASMHFMPVAYIPNTYVGYVPNGATSTFAESGQPSTGATVAFPNLYADIKGIPWLYGGTAWAGTRYYKREEVYISDFFYWNPSGVGAGIEDVSLGQIWQAAPDSLRGVTFSYAAFAVDGEPNANPPLPPVNDLGIRSDFQIRGFRPYQGGELQLGFQFIGDRSNDNPTAGVGLAGPTYGGWGITIRHIQEVLGGDNKLVFQYGRGGGTGFGTLARYYYPDFSLNYSTSESRWRALDVLTIQPTDWFGLQADVVAQHDNSTPSQTGYWFSAGTRASIGFTQHAKLLGEVGHDSFFVTNGQSFTSNWRDLTKFTGAVALCSAKGFMARPELRLFYTWAMWNSRARTATSIRATSIRTPTT